MLRQLPLRYGCLTDGYADPAFHVWGMASGLLRNCRLQRDDELGASRDGFVCAAGTGGSFAAHTGYQCDRPGSVRLPIESESDAGESLPGSECACGCIPDW